MDSQDPFNPPWINPPNDAPRNPKGRSKGPHSNTVQQPGASPTSPLTSTIGTTLVQPQSEGQFFPHGIHPPPVGSASLNISQKSFSGLDHRSSLSEHQPWPGEHGRSEGHPLHAPQVPLRANDSGHPYISTAIPPSTVPLDSSLRSNQYCRIPGCRNKAYYNYAEQEQTEYCGHGHELQAITTGLVNSCAMCKQRPRRTGERVCGRTCRERERQATQVQGSYYGVPSIRREPRVRPGT